MPRNVKHLRGFLGLTGYYRRFIQNYGQIYRPLTSLLKQDSFRGTDEAQSAFELLKQTMTNPPMLVLPDFDKPFYIETDASGTGMGAVLMHNSHPIPYISEAFFDKNVMLSSYERELFAIVFAVKKWQHYLGIHPFVIRTDQRSLKYILEQKMATPFQQKWLSKLAGFDFAIEYKKGEENQAADPESQQHNYWLWKCHLSVRP